MVASLLSASVRSRVRIARQDCTRERLLSRPAMDSDGGRDHSGDALPWRRPTGAEAGGDRHGEWAVKSYIVAAVKPWNVEAFRRRTPGLPGCWHLVERRGDLTAHLVREIAPRYVFFPHWSWRVPERFLEVAECVCFHMTDVPYGRGGSPLQNLIFRRRPHTVVAALRMVAELDAGPVYARRPLALDGRAQDIYERAAETVFDMIAEMITTEPAPEPQRGRVTRFGRRRPSESVLPGQGSLAQLCDHIRMLDADTYPRAFLEHGRFRLEFSHACLHDDRLEARVTIRPRPAPRQPKR